MGSGGMGSFGTMKIKENVALESLLDYGFEAINKEEAEDDGDYTIANYDYKFTIGHSRRGQVYYILIHGSRTISLFASDPDGSGGTIGCPDILIKLISDGIVESTSPPKQ